MKADRLSGPSDLADYDAARKAATRKIVARYSRRSVRTQDEQYMLEGERDQLLKDGDLAIDRMYALLEKVGG